MVEYNRMVNSRDNDYEHYLKCGKCGWEGWAASMVHGYQAYGQGKNADVEPMDYCPTCGEPETNAEVYIVCHRQCIVCNDRFLCHTMLSNLPKGEIGFYSKGEQWLKI
jgi:hypothetical protein